MKTPNAVIGVIGTDFYVSYDGNKTTVICYTGKVSVTPIGNAKVVKNSGQSTQDQILVSAGQMVVISSEIPPAGFEPQSTPPEVQRASIEDTSVPDRSTSGPASAPGAQRYYWRWSCSRGMDGRDNATEHK